MRFGKWYLGRMKHNLVPQGCSLSDVDCWWEPTSKGTDPLFMPQFGILYSSESFFGFAKELVVEVNLAENLAGVEELNWPYERVQKGWPKNVTWGNGALPKIGPGPDAELTRVLEQKRLMTRARIASEQGVDLT
jgi:hypothetical protein